MNIDISSLAADMDWTGGIRRRYAAAKGNPLVQKQKAYFAKARAKMHHTPASSSALKNPFATAMESFMNSTNAPATQQPSRDGPHSRGPQRSSSRVFVHSKDINPTGNAHIRSTSKSRESQIHATSVISDVGPSEDLDDGARAERMTASRDSSAMADQELLLLANRRRLLAKKDWLRLGPTKPLRMTFPTAHDRDRIGKRRKISKSGSQRAKSARRRLITPLYEERIKLAEPVMSGALPNDEMHEPILVRIGTDAFASQSYHSRHSQMPARLSARRQSADFDLISEESMLLGADGDSFDANMVRIPTDVGKPHASNDNGESAVAYHGSQASGPAYGSQNYQVFPMSFSEQLQYLDTASEAETPQYYESFKADHTEWRQATLTQGVYQPFSTPYAKPTELTELFELDQGIAQLQRELEDSTSCRSLNVAQSPVATADSGFEWERFLGVNTHPTTHASTVALYSSSQPFTTSSSLQRPTLGFANPDSATNGQQISTPKGAGTQASFLRNQPAEIHAGGAALDSEVQSPSASLQQTTHLAQQPNSNHPPRPSTTHDQDPDDDALWRQFIVGSRSSDGSGWHDIGIGKHAKPGSAHLPLSPTANTQAAMSTKSTHGTSLFVTGRTPSASGVTQVGHHTTNESRATVHSDNDSLALELECVEETTPAPQVTQKQGNIHAALAKQLNPKRFKKQTKQPVPKVQPASKFMLDSKPRSDRRCRTARHSVYDLVDSDGASLVS